MLHNSTRAEQVKPWTTDVCDSINISVILLTWALVIETNLISCDF